MLCIAVVFCRRLCVSPAVAPPTVSHKFAAGVCNWFPRCASISVYLHINLRRMDSTFINIFILAMEKNDCVMWKTLLFDNPTENKRRYTVLRSFCIAFITIGSTRSLFGFMTWKFMVRSCLTTCYQPYRQLCDAEKNQINPLESSASAQRRRVGVNWQLTGEEIWPTSD